MGQRVVRVGELVGPIGAGDLAGQPVRHAVVAFRRIGRHGRRRDDHLRAVGAEQTDLVLAHLVGQHEDASVAPDRGHQREPDPRVAGRGFDDRPAGREQAFPLRLVDHLHRDTVFHAAAGVEVLHLCHQRRFEALPEPVQPDQGCSSHRVQDAVSYARHSILRRSIK